MPMPATQIRRGAVILFNGDPHRVIDFHHHTPGNLRAFVQAKMRNLKTGSTIENRFRAADTVEKASLSTQALQFLYGDPHHYHFMNNETFEMIELDDEALGDAAQWLVPNMTILAEFYEGKPIGIELPSALEFTVVETEPVLKGATQSASPKPAKLENGVTINVPPFINEGDRIRVDPTEGKYLERAK
jgi:elongation factor P